MPDEPTDTLGVVVPALEIVVAIPLMTAFIGYVTNVAAVRMIFHPRHFVGVGPIGWQGIVHRLAPKFAAHIAATTSKVLTAEDVIRQLAPASVHDLPPELDEALEPAMARVADRVRPGLWSELAPMARTTILEQVRKEAVDGTAELVEQLSPLADTVLDLPSLVVEMLSGDESDRLARVTQEIGAKELRFIERFGAVVGFAIGVLQVLVYSLFSQWWTMPVVGAVVGLGTNWLAIQMVFRPFEPTRFLGLMTYQGLFPKRQAEIAADYGSIAAREILTPENLLRTLRKGGQLDQVAALAREVMGQRVRALHPMLTALAGETAPPSPDQLTDIVLAEIAATPELEDGLEAHLDRRLALDTLIEERLGELSKPEFERMLRGIFEEDEIILVAIGGVLGAGVGCLQAAVVLALQP